MALNVPSHRRMNKCVSLLLVMIASSTIASAQLVSVGVKAGVPFLGQPPGQDESRPYVVGPSIEFRLPAGFAIEVDALYRRIGDTTRFGSIIAGGSIIASSPLPFPSVTFLINRQRGNYWEFPMLGKYYFRRQTSAWQPFLGTGYAFRTVGTHQDISETIVDEAGNSRVDSFRVNSRSDLGVGAVFAAGVRFRAGHFKVLPEFRYTRWGSSDNFQIRKNEAAFLLGISF